MGDALVELRVPVLDDFHPKIIALR